MGKLTVGPDVKHHPDNRESQELFVCGNCGNTDNTDIVGTLNILEREYRLLDCGE
ncbi:zinc ribbon domain-containing protein [Vibrio lentus]|uniref:zinc ribbon domain-containing protein n=1 Tax=Vibrio lentus TaxID=136468 RepID=UPI0010566C35|nr:zinc ribbon domain-containing protein [Vibrio lentus]